MTNVIRSGVAMSTRLLFTLSLVGMAPTALAALGELDIPSYPYTPLGSIGSPITGVTGTWHGLGTVKLKGWSFPFAKTNWTEFMISSDGFMTVGNGQKVCQCSGEPTDEDCQFNEGCNYEEPPYGSTEYEKTSPCCTEVYTFAPQFSPGLIAPSYMGNEYDSYGSSTPFLGTISYLQGGSPGAHYLIVDYNGVGLDYTVQEYYYCGQCPCPAPNNNYCYDYPEVLGEAKFPRQFQAIMFESGAIVFTYGTYPSNGTASIPNYGTLDDYAESIFGAYFPPPDGGMGITDAGTMLGPSKLYASGGCMNTWESLYEGEFCYLYEGVWPELATAYMGDLGSPFLNSLPTPIGSATANGPQINISVTITNNGKTKQTGGFPVDFFLVPQGVAPFALPSTCTAGPPYPCLATSFPAAQSMTFNADIPAGGSASQMLAVSLPSPLPPTGTYAVASVIDPLNTTVKASAPLLEIGISTQLLALGQDMTAKIDVTNFTSVQAGEFSVPIDFTNLGLEEAIIAPYTVSLIGADGTPYLVVPTASVSGIAGVSSELVNQDITIPTNPALPAGVYQIQVSIGAGVPADLNMLNNTIVGIQKVVNGQDMTGTIVSAPFSIATPTSFTVPVTFRNLGLQAATSIPWTMNLTSADGTASYQIGGDVISLAGLGSLTQALSATISQTLPSGSYTLSLTLGNTSQGGSGPATPDLNTANNIILATAPVYVYSQTADYAVGPGDLVLDGSAHAADGQVISVTRTIHNLQGAAPPCQYSYFLNPPSVTEVGNGVPVAILTPTGPSYEGTTPPFGAYGQEGSNNTVSERIVIPVGMPVGTYNLVLALVAGNDINPANNDTYVSLNLATNSLQITSPSSLLAAIVQTPYYYKLQASGQGADASWSLLAGALPTGIALDSAGELTGTPTTPGVYTIVVQLASQGGTQVAVLDLPVAAGSGALSIEQGGAQLPSAIVGSNYLQQLVAQGGVPPYTWKGTIPQSFSMNLTLGGVLAGKPTEATDGPVQFTVVVTDAIGTQASATLTLQVIAPGGLTITTPFLQPAVVGTQYDQPILASDGTITGATFNWSLPTGTTLPAGITFQEIGNPAVADLSGEATQAGIFPIVVNLSDNFGHTTQRQYILTVTEAAVLVHPQKLPVAVIGQTYAGQLQATSVSTLSWRIFSGALPPGLSLAPTGSISGTVPSNTVTGTYPFAAAVTDSGGAESVVPLEIQVELAPVSSGGCATGTGPAGAGLLLLAFAWLARRRRRVQGSVLAAVGALLLSAPVALGQVPLAPCGTPPKPIAGAIHFQDITGQVGYVPLAAPVSTNNSTGFPPPAGSPYAVDKYSDFFGGVGGNCDFSYCYSESSGQETDGPWGQSVDVATISLPFPFGFSGIYADGGSFNPLFQVNVWANELLTFNPSVSFNPFAYPLNPIPPNSTECEVEIETPNEYYDFGISQPVPGAVSDTFGGFPFDRQYAPPNALIAPWWGDLSLCPNQGSVGWLLTLDDNNLPMAVIQWSNATATIPESSTICPADYSSCLNSSLQPNAAGSRPQFSFQVRLHANNDVDFVYGPSSNFTKGNDCFDSVIGNCDYISGIQSNLLFPDNIRPPLLDYATQALNCSAVDGCTQSEFPAANTSVTFKDVFRSVGPDLQLVGLTPPLLVPQGGTFTVPVQLSNGGGSASTGQGQIEFFFSAGGTTPQGGAFSIQNVPPYAACDVASFDATVSLPPGTPQGGGYLIAEFIPGPESVDSNITYASAPVIVGQPQPDLAAIGSLDFSPPALVAGQPLTIQFTAQNVGQIDVPGSAYGVYVSLGGAISPSSIQIGSGIIPPLATGASYEMPASTTVQLPLTLVSGDYFIGAIVDPANTLKESNLANNIALGRKLLEVTSPGPVIVTTSLQDAQVSAPYSVQIVAGGGDGKYQWSLAAGALPGGLTLSKNGRITGQAETVGTSTFTVKVTDGVGHSATAVLSIGVNPFDQVLTIETVNPPPGSTGQLYNFTIAAVGGVPPYQWALVSPAGTLPPGISLVSNGTLTGEPQYDGTSNFQVSVTDSVGTTVVSPVYTLTIFAAGALAVGSTALRPALIGASYSDTLHSAGGTPPYTWSLIDVFREPGNPGDEGSDLGASLMGIGLGFYPAQGEVEGVPTEVGVFALTVQVTDNEQPPASAQGLVLLTVSSTKSFSFETVTLPPATLNQFYSTTIQTNAPANDMVTCQVITGSEIPNPIADQFLPPGVTVYSNCQVQGVPLEAGTFSFLVEATDTQGGFAIQSFTIQVTAPPATKPGGGCRIRLRRPGTGRSAPARPDPGSPASASRVRLLLFLSLTALAPAAFATVDYAVGPGDLLLESSATAADGQVIGVTRTIHNLQGAAPACPYGYFLNPPTVFLEGNGVPVSILNPGLSPGSTNLGSTPPFGAYGAPNASDTATNQLVIPDGMPPGTYNLVLVLDPEQQVADADPSNNDTWVAISLTTNPLQITSASSLPVAIVGAPYDHVLTERGGGPQSTWSLLAGALPNGISLDPLGVLSGTPTEAGAFDIVVQVASVGDTQTALLVLPVAADSAPLSIEQSGPALPSAAVNSLYVLQLVAEGGVPPYSWSGIIPPALGLSLSSAGVLSGTPQAATNGPVQLTVTVTDASGAQATASMTLQIISPSDLVITTPFLQPGVVGMQYDQPIFAADGTLGGAILNWSLSPSTPLPAGFTFQEIGSPPVADLSGEPTHAGIFPLIVSVSDNFGHSTSRQYILTVTGGEVPVPPASPLVAVIGEPFYTELQATGVSTLSWSLFSGQLPPGLSMSTAGIISGTVPIGTQIGTYTFAGAVTVTDSGGAESVVPIEIQIQVVAAPPQLQGHTQSGGCATGDGPIGAGLLLLAMAWLKLSRPRVQKPFGLPTQI